MKLKNTTNLIKINTVSLPAFKCKLKWFSKPFLVKLTCDKLIINKENYNVVYFKSESLLKRLSTISGK